MNIIDTEIPSDSESVDGLVESENENVESDNLMDNTTPPDTNIDEVTDSDSDSEGDRLLDKNGDSWRRRGCLETKVPFTKISGPNIPDLAKTPLDIFFCLLPTEFVDLLVHQTNLYVNQKDNSSKKTKKAKSEPVTREEILTFLGINILMGVKKLPSYRDYWSLNYQLRDTYISSAMSVNRFGFLLTHLHLNDNSKEPKRGHAAYDKLYKIRPLVEILSKTFQDCWQPSENQSVDESMVKFKGRSSMKQYLPNKPIKRGYKIWVRSDQSAFVCQFQIYTGKEKNSKKEDNLGNRVVTDLTRTLVGNYHRVYFDNFFTGKELMISLKKDKILACGTVRSNRKGLPKDYQPDNKMKTGDSEFRSSSSGIGWVKWKDNRAVYALSNFHDPSKVSDVNRKNKDGSINVISCPNMIKDYNQHMGYVDKSDMLKSLYEIDRKSKKWWHRILDIGHHLPNRAENLFLKISRVIKCRFLTTCDFLQDHICQKLYLIKAVEDVHFVAAKKTKTNIMDLLYMRCAFVSQLREKLLLFVPH
ncbi:piggyBac transposable element-derived protein 4-like [Leptopilina boulardi]|uniref:piggyBac transposable element-derived protein 4-like n=1 Tax=Leptopilina boulardi TaxID=63433 RepID=UPI0021F6587A|nr:piggyBac transposable element-derived protein 4-like [Leptopilina boulardi]